MFALGTVQLGLTYGINNRQGLPSGDEVSKILELAWLGGVRWLDTAASYGLSEERIGDFFVANPDKKFSVVTKLPVQLGDVTSARSSLNESLRKLKLKKLDCLMLHNTDHIARLASDLGKFLVEEKTKGTISEVGASVYSVDQLKEVSRHPEVTVVQIPANVFDQRFLVPEAITVLRQKRVFVRSVFLQGLLLMAKDEAAKRMPLASKHILQWHQLADQTRLPLEVLALGWVRKALPGATPLVGCENAVQLQKNLEIWEKGPIDDKTFKILSALKCDIEDIILPMKWKPK